MSTTPTPTRSLDTLGTACPMPIIELAKAITELEPGDIVEVLADDPGAKVDVPVWCRMQRHRFIGRSERENGGWAFLIEKVG